MRLTGAVWVPASLLDEAGGSIISNNVGGLVSKGGSLVSNNSSSLISNNAGGLVGNGGSLSSKNTAYRLQQLAERTLEGATVVLADPRACPMLAYRLSAATHRASLFSRPYPRV
jgi:hypothetical protein